MKHLGIILWAFLLTYLFAQPVFWGLVILFSIVIIFKIIIGLIECLKK